MNRMIIGMMTLAVLGAACTTPQASTPVSSSSSDPPAQPVPSGPDALTPVNDVSAQGSVRTAIAASSAISKDHDGYTDLTAAGMESRAPLLRFATPSTIYTDVSFEVRDDATIALVAISPSGVCFGALDEGLTFSYSHSGAGRTSCDAADVPYSSPSWPGSYAAQR